MKKSCIFSLALSLILLAPSPALAENSPAPANPTSKNHTLTATNSGSESHKNFRSQQEAENYWTPEKMLNAIPADTLPATSVKQTKNNIPYNQVQGQTQTQEEPEVLAEAVAPQQAISTYSLGQLANSSSKKPSFVRVPSSVGKVFYTRDGKNYVCSGSAITSEKKNLVLTAAHCLHGGRNKNWDSHLVFAPAFYYGQTPHGLWYSKNSVVSPQWSERTDYRADQGFFEVSAQSDGRELTDVVGGNGITLNASPAQNKVRVWGWPAQAPYNGEVAQYCYNQTKPYEDDESFTYMGCTLTRGASGGPWFIEEKGPNQGQIFAVTSVGGERYNYPFIATVPLGSSTKELYQKLQQ
ncbi:MAG: trypsin-like serine protease [Rothia sp. (in: high G+C Gram-positive bacteria)]|nr:trypsin-like serine protease [Rothia sp. (in: high G+C Gram-positive bacteria)]